MHSQQRIKLKELINAPPDANHHFDGFIKLEMRYADAAYTAKPHQHSVSKLRKPSDRRNLFRQFSTSQTEQIIHGLKEGSHHKKCSYTYRKHLMEAFLFVNQAGNDLPIYLNKPAKDLTDGEIQDLFLKISRHDKSYQHLDRFQKNLYALGLMREAMYRTTAIFPDEKTMITLIHYMMHKSDVTLISKPDSSTLMLDILKAALLWLSTYRVDVATVIPPHAKHLTNSFSPFLSFLGISHSDSPITASSPVEHYCQEGINIGTLPEFCLFYLKARSKGVDLELDGCLSLVLSESVSECIDDDVVYSYAVESVDPHQPSIYRLINEFVTTDQFTKCDTSAEEDVTALKKYLHNRLRNLEGDARYDLSDTQYKALIESAILVNYRLKEGLDYIIAMNTVNQSARFAGVLMRNGMVNPDIQFGDGIQQLLHAKLNVQYPLHDFPILPQGRTIASTIKRNQMDFYRSMQGLIWQSTNKPVESYTLSNRARYHNDLYSVLDYFRNCLTNLSETYYLRHWSTFAAEIENDYRERKCQGNYQQEQFLDAAVNAFNRFSTVQFTCDDVLTSLNHETLPAPSVETPYLKRVRVADCTPPSIIAYQYLSGPDQPIGDIKKEVKSRLKKIFSGIKHRRYHEAGKEYLSYLNDHAHLETIREAHEEYIILFLEKNAKKSHQRPFMTRWLGYQGRFNKIARDQNYLLMFKALNDVAPMSPSSPDIIHAMKVSIISLLKEYVENSWFINRQRKAIARNFIQKISQVQNLDQLTELLQGQKLSLIKNDVALNQHSFWRKSFRPMHLSGQSRFQSTLNHALNLTSVIAKREISPDLVERLNDELKPLSKNEKIPCLSSLDAFKTSTSTLSFSDPHNAAVIIQSIESALSTQSMFSRPSGIAEREPTTTALRIRYEAECLLK